MTILMMTYFLFDRPTEKMCQRLLNAAMTFDAMGVLLFAHACKVI